MFKKLFYKNSRGVSLAEALAAISVAMIVMIASYTVYSNFQSTFVRQIGHNNLKQEARFALHVLQLDSRMAAYKHPDSTLGAVEKPVKVKVGGESGTEVTNDSTIGDIVYFCFDTEDSAGNITRKLFAYELRKAVSTSADKRVLKKKTWTTTNCDPDDDDTTQESNWTPVAENVVYFGIRLRSKHIDYEIRLRNTEGNITETYSASAFMRNLNFGGKNYYVYDETDLHENRTSVLPFTGSLRVTCDNNQKIDIQLPNFVTDNKQIIELHQGDLLSDTDKRATHGDIHIEAVKPPGITGIPALPQGNMKLNLSVSSSSATVPAGLTVSSGTDDGTLKLSGQLNKTDSGYTFNDKGYQDFVMTVKAELKVTCQNQDELVQNNSFKNYTVRVHKFSAPQFSDINLWNWDAKGGVYGEANYERLGTRPANGGPFFNRTTDGRAYYIQQNLSSPAFLVSKDEYDSFVLKGMVCTGEFPECDPRMSEWLDNDMLGFAVGYKRPSVNYKVWPDNRIRACAGVDYNVVRRKSGYNESRLRNSLRLTAERNAFNADKSGYFGPPADDNYTMYMFSWWASAGNRSAVYLTHFYDFKIPHTHHCGLPESSSAWWNTNPYNAHSGIWSRLQGNDSGHQAGGMDVLLSRTSSTRPAGTGLANCWSLRNSFADISFAPGATYDRGCHRNGRNVGVKNVVTMTYNPSKWRFNVDNKPIVRGANSQRLTLFHVGFDSSGAIKDYRTSVSGTPISLPGSGAKDELEAANFKRFQKGQVAMLSFSQPNNRYSNMQIAKLPRYVPPNNATNKPMPQNQNLYFYMSDQYNSVNKIYGLLSKSYDPIGHHIEVMVPTVDDDDSDDNDTSDSENCTTIGGRGTAEYAGTGNYTTENVDGSNRIINCRLSGTWRATTEEWARNRELPNIGEMYDTKNKSNYSGARAIVQTTQGGEIQVFADGSFQYSKTPDAFKDGATGQDSFYYAVQTDDTANNRISEVKKVYIGYNIANNAPTGVSFREDGSDEDDAAIALTDVDIAEDDKDDVVVAEIFVTSSQEPDANDFVRFNLGQIPMNHPDADVDHAGRFRIDQKDGRFYLVLNDSSDIRWASLPENKKFFKVRIIATDLRGNQFTGDYNVNVDRVDCSEVGMENVKIYKTKAAMTIEGYILATAADKAFRRQTVPLTSASDLNNDGDYNDAGESDGLDSAEIRFDFPARNVQPSIKVQEKVISFTQDGQTVERVVGIISNRCRDNHAYVDVQQMWSD